MLVATITDVQQQKIFNWTTYTGILVAFTLSGIASVLDRHEFVMVGFVQSLLGFLLCSVVMLVCFVLFQIGGGDVKLLAMAGAFMGPALGIETLLWTFVLGGATAVIILIWKLGAIKLFRRVVQQLMHKLGLGSWDSLTEEEQRQLKLPLYLAPSALFAVVIVRFELVNQLLNR